MDSRSPGGRVRTLPGSRGASSGGVHDDGSPNLKTGARPRLEGGQGSEGSRPPQPSSTNLAAAPRVRSLPPFDPTTVSPGRIRLRPMLSTPTPKPILASECLRDEAAPDRPHDEASRKWYLVLGIALATCGGASYFLAPIASRSAFDLAVVALGAVVACGAFLRSYGARAAIVLVTALAAIAVHLDDSSPLLLARALPPVVLAAALFLRAAYRGDRFVRVLLALGIATFIASAALGGDVAPWSSGAGVVTRVTAGAVVVVSLFGLLGFMSDETTAGASTSGVLVLVVAAATHATPLFSRVGEWPSLLGRGLELAVAISVAACALYQLVALVIAPRARAEVVTRPSFNVAPPDSEHGDSTLE